MKRIIYTSLMAVVAYGWSSTATIAAPITGAAPLSGEYTINATATQLDEMSWRFDYQITNNNQQTGSRTGLDGFLIQIPDTAQITNVSNPVSYWGMGGNWGNFVTTTASEGYKWYQWWGFGPASTYPQGTTAAFSISLEGVTVGLNDGQIVTYWGHALETPPPTQNYHISSEENYYSNYSTQLLSPMSPVPVPASILLLGTGMASIAGIKLRKKKV